MRFALILVGIYLVYALSCYLWQRQILFPGKQILAPPPVLPDRAERIWLSCSFGRVESWYLPAVGTDSQTPRPVLIFAHGNGELIDYWPQTFAALAPKGIAVLLVEYPGYGRSQGIPSQQSVTEAMVSAYERIIQEPEVDPRRVILMGRSLGGAAACQLAARRSSAALILMSAFTGVRPFARNFLMPAFLVRNPFDNLAVLQSYRQPILLIHGRYDAVVPYQHALQLHSAAAHSRLITYECGHNDCPPSWPKFWDQVLDFLRDNGIVQDRAEDT